MRVSDDVLAVLGRAQIEGGGLKLIGQLDRALYVKTDKVLSAAGGKWNRKAGAHLFTTDPWDVIEQILLTGEIAAPKDFGFFPTPEAIVERLIQLAQLRAGMVVLEPSAGHGAILKGVAKCAVVDCYELLEKNIAVLNGLGLARRVIQADFLKVEPAPVYDAVVMNPPFAPQQADIRHVLHALKFVKPGGRLSSVMAAGVLFRENRMTADFRELVGVRGGTIEENPEGAFRESGTLVRTVNVMIPA